MTAEYSEGKVSRFLGYEVMQGVEVTLKDSANPAELGQTIGKPRTIFENSANANSYLANANSSYGYGGKVAEEESTVAPGQVSLGASVNVSFELQRSAALCA